MLLDLLLDSGLELVEIGVAQPLGAGLHSVGEGTGHGDDAGITRHDRRRAVGRGAGGELVLAKRLRAGLESIGEHRWYRRCLLPDRRRDALHTPGHSTVLGAAWRAALVVGIAALTASE